MAEFAHRRADRRRTRLKDGRIAGAGLDVLEEEPPDPDDPLLALENVYFTPHISFYSEESIVRLRTATVESVVDVLSGRVPRSVVNPAVLSGLGLEAGGGKDA